MNTSIYSGVSGLLASQKALDVSSHNISNVNTVGYKSDTVSFQDMMYANGGVGLGTSVVDITKSFSQGNINSTGYAYDFAVMGEGFFTVESKHTLDQIAYTRAGNFQRDQDGFLVSSVGDYVLGNPPTITTVPQTTVVDSELYTRFIASGKGATETSHYTINAYSSNYHAEARAFGNIGVSGDGLKNPDSIISDIEALGIGYQYTLNQNQSEVIAGEDVVYKEDTITFRLPLVFNKSMDITVNGVKYQEMISQDKEQTFKNLTDKVSSATGLSAKADYATGIITITSTIPGENFVTRSAKNGEDNALIITTSEASGSGQKLISAFEEKLRGLITDIGGSFVTSKSEVDIPVSGDQFTSKIQLDLSNPILGISDVSMGELFQEDGKLYIKQLNADYLVGYLAPVVFVNNGGLNPVGANKYLQTEESGDPKYIEDVSSVRNQMLEISNTDLSESLVNMMVFQKAFESNSKTVTTSDEMLKTALQLKAR